MYKYKRSSRDDDKSVLVWLEGRTIYFYDEVNSESCLEAVKFIHKLEKESKSKEILIIINSGGGNCYDGLGLYDTIRDCPCNIVTRASGLAASMALILFLAGDEREMTVNARLLSHQISIEDFCGRAQDFKIEEKEIAYLGKVLREIIAERTDQAVSKIKKEQLPGDFWIGLDRAIKEGYSDRLYDPSSKDKE
jgi:ATP-dependent Clp protease protease subunit